jgi:uncharacterized delta-60 repeat protein
LLVTRGQAGDADKALGYFTRDLELSEALLKANPGSAQASRDVLCRFGRETEPWGGGTRRSARVSGSARFQRAVSGIVPDTRAQTGGHEGPIRVMRTLTMDTPFTADPPALADLELIRAKINELILALRRQAEPLRRLASAFGFEACREGGGGGCSAATPHSPRLAPPQSGGKRPQSRGPAGTPALHTRCSPAAGIRVRAELGVDSRAVRCIGAPVISRPSLRSLIPRLANAVLLLGVLLLGLAEARAGIVNAVYNSAADVPVSVPGDYTATGLTVNFTLNYAPTAGTSLTVVRLTGSGTINGAFANLAQNQAVTLGFAGQTYDFVANYNAGPGSNDLVLQWAGTRALAWGSNGNGQAGNGVNDSVNNLPVAVTSSGVLSGKTIIALSAGGSHSVALCSDGTVAAWGSNTNGQIGANGAGQSNVPVIVSTLGVLSSKRVIAIAAGATHSLALCSDGTVAAWGLNTSGQLGNGGGGSTGTPVAVNTSGVLSGKKVVAIAAGQYHSMALLSTGVAVTWGANGSGQLGNASNTTSGVPVLVDATGVLLNKTVTAIAAGQLHCLVLCSDGTLMSWGANGDGQLGTGDNTPSNVPVKVAAGGTVIAGKTVIDVEAGGFHSLVLCLDGTVATWGQNTYGQLGISSGSHYLPNAVATSGTPLAGKTVTAIAGGFQHSLAICSDGTLAAWGLNSTGQLGTGNFSTSGVPVAVSTAGLVAGEKFQVPASGANAQHSLAIVAGPYTPFLYTTGTLISNGSFESGFSNWTTSDLSFSVPGLAVRTNGFSPGYGLFSNVATDGIRAATSGFEGSGPGVIRLSHDVPVTAAEPYLRFDWRAGWDMLTFTGSTLPRTFSVAIEPVGGGPVMQNTVMLTAVSHTKNLDTGSQTGVIDLSAFTGTTVRVCFDLTVPEFNTGPAYFQLDNVRTAALLPATSNPITRPATALALHGATLNGIVNPGGLATTVEFQYGTTTSYGGIITDVQGPYHGNTDVAASATVTGLPANTLCHYRVRTTNSAGTKYGADATFTTLPFAPVISDSGYNYVSPSSVDVYALVDPNGASTVVSFEYGPTTDYGSSTPAWESSLTEFGGAHGGISGLTGGVPLYWRVKAQNAGGITYSAGATYTPDPPHGEPIPAVNTLAPVMVERRFATLRGTVNANGSSVGVFFDFGETTHSGLGATAFPSPVSGSTVTAVSGTVSNLSPGTTYHYRTRAYSPNGYVYGPDVTFSTPPIGFPAASTGDVTDVTPTTAVLGGFATANNGPLTTVSFDYGPDTNYGNTVTAPGFANANSFGPVQAQIPVSGDGVTYHYRIKAKNHIGTTYGQDMTFLTPDPHEARLYGLTLGSGALSPAFDRNVLAYTVSLAFDAASLWLSPTASTGIGSVTVNGTTVTSGGSTGEIPLNAGANVISITITALDGTTQQTYTITVTRALPKPGDLDLSFNGTGKVITNVGNYDHASAVAVQSDGRIVLVGGASNGNDEDLAVARYHPDGTPDLTFNGTGAVLTDIDASPNGGACVALQSDGRIVVAGSVYYGNHSDFAVVRYNSDGTLDTTFNGTGKVVTPFGPGYSSASGIAVQADGRIVVGGYASNGTDNDFVLLRYHGNVSTGTPGTLDTTFNGTGKVLTDFGATEDFLTSIALQGDGRIVAAGSSYDGNNGNTSCALARYGTDGTLDTTFNGTGKVITDLCPSDDVFHAVAIQGDGKIVAAGYARAGVGGTNVFAIVRYHGNSATGAPGTPDVSFNTTGKILAPIGIEHAIATGVLLPADGKVVVTGYANIFGNIGFAVARYTADGIPDPAFNGTGLATTDFGIGSGYALGAAWQSDGKILVAGYDTGGIFEDFTVVRYLGDGPAINVQAGPDVNVFDGISTVQFPGAYPGANSSVTFTIQDTGTANLTGLGITLDGPDATAFEVATNPVAPVTPFGSTTFTVRFSAASRGTRHATMHIATNVPGSNASYDIALSGTGLVSLGDWRQQFFGTAGNTGDAADDADPYHTGVPNLAVFAILGPDQNPATVSAGQLPQPHFSGPNYGISFTQPAEVGGVTYGAEWSEDMAPGNWHPVSDTGSDGTHTFMVPIGINMQIFMRLKVTRP